MNISLLISISERKNVSVFVCVCVCVCAFVCAFVCERMSKIRMGCECLFMIK